MINRPPSTAALADLLRTGAGPWHVTGQSAGPIPPAAMRVDLGLLDRARQVNAGDLDVEVEAGASLDALHEALAAHGLALTEAPVLLPGGIGGHVARGGLGTLEARSLQRRLLGLELVTWSGAMVRPGGRTVKNVTGYDLVRPACGAWSRFGVITAVVLSVEPAPPARFAAQKATGDPATGLAEARAAGAGHGVAIRNDDAWTVHCWTQGRDAAVGRSAKALAATGFREAPWEWIDARPLFGAGIGLAGAATALLSDEQGGLASPGHDLPVPDDLERAAIAALAGLRG
jgi:FAD/FMN-containing dehydrogenase